jgi:glycosyltransferase involved in cell wall biosynthesis
LYPDECVTAISRFQWAAYAEQFGPTAVVHHGLDASRFTFRAAPEDYLCYLGRFVPGKGVLHAVAASKRAGLPLLLAGPENDYYRTHVAPHVDGRAVRYVGFIGASARDALLGGARALLYPIETPEPFGLVMPEAMMCGTPVVATRCGVVPEIVDIGVTGSLADAVEELPDRIVEAAALDRRRVRDVAAERFSAAKMAAGYLAVYESLVRGDGKGAR